MKKQRIRALLIISLLFAIVLLLLPLMKDESPEPMVQGAMPVLTEPTVESTKALSDEAEDITESETEIVEKVTEPFIKDETQTEEDATEDAELEVDKVPTTEENNAGTEPIINVDHYSCDLSEIYCTSPVRDYTEEQKELIAKMLYCEAGGTGWDCQVATCSAIINLIEYNNGDFSILDKTNVFTPAYFYRGVTPMQTQYDVLNYVLSGGLIADIKYFRTDYYHSFGASMFAIDNVYFSK